MVVDDGMSSNGTFVNEEQVSGKRRLRDGDVVRAGATRMTFHERVGGAPGGTVRRPLGPHLSDRNGSLLRRSLGAQSRARHVDETGVVPLK